MEIQAKLKHLRMSPRKVRLVVDIVRGLSIPAALDQLKFINKKAALPVAKLLKSAVANGENTYSLKEDNLYIREIRVDEGKTLKRWLPRAHGRATTIRKRASHITLILAEIKPSAKKTKKVVKTEAPIRLDKMMENKGKKSGKETKSKDTVEDKGKELKEEPSTSHNKSDSSKKGFTSKVFRRKSG